MAFETGLLGPCLGCVFRAKAAVMSQKGPFSQGDKWPNPFQAFGKSSVSLFSALQLTRPRLSSEAWEESTRPAPPASHQPFRHPARTANAAPLGKMRVNTSEELADVTQILPRQVDRDVALGCSPWWVLQSSCDPPQAAAWGSVGCLKETQCGDLKIVLNIYIYFTG